ncbi:hypothetical protein [Clostridium sp. AM58-1XD]|uniref:hypothetical protein n=1 Tax=Clostridium sp. AM58-1XD TaxID=2292307 RepID=UPI0026D521DF
MRRAHFRTAEKRRRISGKTRMKRRFEIRTDLALEEKEGSREEKKRLNGVPSKSGTKMKRESI